MGVIRFCSFYFYVYVCLHVSMYYMWGSPPRPEEGVGSVAVQAGKSHPVWCCKPNSGRLRELQAPLMNEASLEPLVLFTTPSCGYSWWTLDGLDRCSFLCSVSITRLWNVLYCPSASWELPSTVSSRFFVRFEFLMLYLIRTVALKRTSPCLFHCISWFVLILVIGGGTFPLASVSSRQIAFLISVLFLLCSGNSCHVLEEKPQART